MRHLTYTKNCLYDKKEFKSTRNDALFCSHACRSAFNRALEDGGVVSLDSLKQMSLTEINEYAVNTAAARIPAEFVDYVLFRVKEYEHKLEMIKKLKELNANNRARLQAKYPDK